MISPGIPDTLGEFKAAHQRIQGKTHITPLMQCRTVEHALHKSLGKEAGSGPNLWFKCENFQRTGSFKIRGVTNAVQLALERDGENRKFITFSSGNAAQALALVAREAGAEAHLVIPKNAPKVKAKAAEGYGATLHWCEPVIADRARTAKKVQEKVGPLRLIHSSDNRDVIAGQGTVLLEIMAQLSEQCNGAIPDAIIVPVGGGGLLGGVGLAAKLINPNIKIFGAEPLGADDATRGFNSGKVQPHLPGCPSTICDGLRTVLSERTLSAMKIGVDKMFTATEAEIRAAFQLIYERMKIVIEPSAAVGVAVALQGKPELQKCKNVVIVMTGGNLQLDEMSEYITPSKL